MALLTRLKKKHGERFYPNLHWLQRNICTHFLDKFSKSSLLSYVANLRWELQPLDAKNVFIRGDLKRKVYLKISPGFVRKTAMVDIHTPYWGGLLTTFLKICFFLFGEGFLYKYMYYIYYYKLRYKTSTNK